MSTLPSTQHRALVAQVQTLRAELTRLYATQHQDAAQQLEAARHQRSQLRFHTIFDAALTIRQVNAAASTFLGLESPLDLLGHAMLEYAHADCYADWEQLQDALWAHQVPHFTFDTCLVRPNGTKLWCQVTSVLFPDDGGELSYTTLEDISERKQLQSQVQQHTHALELVNEQLAVFNEELQVANEELLEANGQLGKVNAELDTFVYAASHDLRAPISNLEGLVQALVVELPADTQQLAEVAPILDLMRQSMAQFGQTLDRLADFGAAQAADELVREQVNLGVILEEVRQAVAPQLAATQGQLLVDLAGDPSLWFAAKHMYSVVLNLVSNALKYRHPARLPVVRVRSYRDLNRLVVEVQDNGLGLSEGQQRQLFRLFTRLHSHVEGTGVGLYLVRKILDNAGGSVQVKSEVGRGSTFTAIFPA